MPHQFFVHENYMAWKTNPGASAAFGDSSVELAFESGEGRTGATAGRGGGRAACCLGDCGGATEGDGDTVIVGVVGD